MQTTADLFDQHVNDLSNFDEMGNAEINVAYEGTFGDLSSAGAAGLFDTKTDDFDFTQFTEGFTAINGGNTQGVTVSPKDVFQSVDSVPPSSSFTNLTTPGSTFMDTPDEDYQTSPLFTDNLGLDQPSSVDNWFSLFPEEPSQINVPTASAPIMARSTSASSATHIVVHPGGEGNPRKRSSPSNTALGSFSPAVKHSTVAGVNARKRDKPLPPIVVSEDDPVALKRARNTAAARKSRAKKVEERGILETEIEELKAQVEHWRSVALAHGAPASE